MSGSRTAAAGARPGCAARRSPTSPASAPPGTRGSSRAATCARRSTCSRRSARALRLTPAERTHVILLGRGEEPPPCKSRTSASRPTVSRLIENLGPNPAYRARPPLGLPGLERRRDRAIRRPRGRAQARPATTSGCTSWIPRGADVPATGSAARRLVVAKFRADSARHIGDPAVRAAGLDPAQVVSPEFCKLWKRHEVAAQRRGTQDDHPPRGRADGVRARGLQSAGGPRAEADPLLASARRGHAGKARAADGVLTRCGTAARLIES